MATEYYCSGCELTFLGDDPIHMKGGAPAYAECPNSPEAKYFADLDKPENERDLPDDIMEFLDESDRLHPVTLYQKPPATKPKASGMSPPLSKPSAKGNHSAPSIGSPPKQSAPPPSGMTPNSNTVTNVTNAPPPSPWASFKFKEPTEEEKAELQRNAKKRSNEFRQKQNEANDRRLVQRLLERVDRMIESGSYNVSSNFPLDREYGTKQSGKPLSDRGRIITLAGQAWERRGADYSFRNAKYKKVWGEYQANFEKLIVSGEKTQGKHNVHVTRNG